MAVLAAAEVFLLALVLLLVFGLLRSHAAILRRLHALEAVEADVGPAPVRLTDPTTAARPIRGVTLAGEAVMIAVAGVDHDTILAFLSSGCLTCRDFWKTFAGGEMMLPAHTRLVIVAKDLSEESPSELAELAPRGIELVCSSAAWSDFQVPGSPYVIAIGGESGRVQGEGTGLSWEQVSGLLAQATGDRSYVTGERGERVKPVSDTEREARVDRELLNAGIMPGDATLYPSGSTSGDPSR